jgi:hypothetical protein
MRSVRGLCGTLGTLHWNAAIVRLRIRTRLYAASATGVPSHSPDAASMEGWTKQRAVRTSNSRLYGLLPEHGDSLA